MKQIRVPQARLVEVEVCLFPPTRQCSVHKLLRVLQLML